MGVGERWPHSLNFLRCDDGFGRVNARHLDHVNLRIPADGADAARTFYGEQLGFGIEDTLYETGEKPFLDARLSATAVVHLWPTDEAASLYVVDPFGYRIELKTRV